MRRTKINRKNRKNYTKKRGGVITSTKISYPLLPPSPTNKPILKVNNENLKRVEKGTNEYKKRVNYLLKLRKNLPVVPKVENSFFRPNNAFKS